MLNFCAIENNTYRWNRDFISSMPTAAKTKEMFSLVKEYQQNYPKYILEKCGVEEFSGILIDALLSSIRSHLKELVKDEREVYGNNLLGAIEETFQYNFKNFQREWKKYGDNHFMAVKVDLTASFFFEGVKNTFKQGSDRYGLKHNEQYIGVKIIEYILLRMNNRFVMELEEHRRRLREEEKALRELKKEAEKAEKDAAKAQAAIEKNESALAKAKTASQIKKLKAQIEELKAALQRAEERRERAISMAQQTRCGYVYVISNIGSFGEGVYKIGMTRRVDPMQRVRELGDASVPFPFDVHAMIYTEDAPGLESHLHKVFDLYKLNTLNWRKEYFRVPLANIREEVEKCGIQCQWLDTPPAEQYRESEWIRSIGNLDAPELQRFIEEHPEEFASRHRSFEYNPFEFLEEYSE